MKQSSNIYNRDTSFNQYVKQLRNDRKNLELWRIQTEDRMRREEDEKEREKIARVMEEYDKETRNVDQKLQNASKNGEDDDFENYYEKNAKMFEKQNEKQSQKREVSLKLESEHKAVSEKVFQEERELRIQDRYSEKNMNREYRYLLDIDASLPDHIRQNLKNMPNNKGYIWRGVHYYGLKPLTKNDNPRLLVMFEKKRNELLIHESMYGEWKKTFKKLNDGQKKLILSSQYCVRS